MAGQKKFNQPSTLSLTLSNADPDDELDLSDIPDGDIDLSDIPDSHLAIDPSKFGTPVTVPQGMNPVNEPAQKNWWESAYDKFNEPLTGNAIQKWATSNVNAMPQVTDKAANSSFGDKYPGFAKFASQVEGFNKGAYEGLAGVADSFTSPASLISTALGIGGAKAGLAGLSGLQKALAAGEIAIGASQVGHGGLEASRGNYGKAALDILGGAAQTAGGGANWSGYGAKPKARVEIDPNVVIPENLQGINTYAGPERRNTETRPTDTVFQEYKNRLARGEDVRSNEAKKFLEQKTNTENVRNEAAAVREQAEIPEFDPNNNYDTHPNEFNIGPIEGVDDLQLKANRDNVSYPQQGITPEPDVEIVHNPEYGGYQSHRRGTDIYVTHPILDKPVGPFLTDELAQDFILNHQETPEFQQHLRDYNDRNLPDVPINKPTEGNDPNGYKVGEVVEFEGKDYVVSGIEPDGTPRLMDPMDMEVVDDVGGNNASGDSSASLESIGRQNEMKNRGQSYVMYDRDGKATPTIVDDEATHHVPNGMTLAKVGPNGIDIVNHRGGKVPQNDPMAAMRAQVQKGSLAQDNPRMQQMPEQQAAQSVQGYLEGTPEVSTGPLVPENIASSTQTGMGGNQPPNIPPNVANAAAPIPDPVEIATLATQASMMPKGPLKDSYFKLAYDASRELLTSLDLSAFRQAKSMAMTKAFYTSIDDMLKSLGAKGAQAVRESITNDPSGYFKPRKSVDGKVLPSFAEEAGLKVGERQENTGSKIWNFKYSPVRAANRAFNLYLDKVRADNFKRMMNLAKKSGQDLSRNVPEAKKLADFINNGTGSGSLDFKTPEINIPGMNKPLIGGKDIKLEKVADEAHKLFFAPKFMASKIHRYAQVFNYKTWYKPNMTAADKIIRMETMKSLLATAGLSYGMAKIAQEAGARVTWDPNDSDFLKVRVGNTRWDLGAGDNQYLVAAAKLWSGKSTSATSKKTTDLTAGKYGQDTRADVVGDFFANKLAPIPSFTLSMLRGKEFDGKPFEVQQAILNRTVPLVIQDLQEIYKKDPDLIPGYILPFIGVGQQTYGR